jgi:hypothetical protein
MTPRVPGRLNRHSSNVRVGFSLSVPTTRSYDYPPSILTACDGRLETALLYSIVVGVQRAVAEQADAAHMICMTNLKRVRKGEAGQATTNAGHFATKKYSRTSDVSLTDPASVPREDPKTLVVGPDPDTWSIESAAEWRAIRVDGGQALKSALSSCGITFRPALAESGAFYDAVSVLLESPWYRARQAAARAAR